MPLLGKVEFPLGQDLAVSKAFDTDRGGAVRKGRKVQERSDVQQGNHGCRGIGLGADDSTLNATRASRGARVRDRAIHTLHKNESVDSCQQHVREHECGHIVVQEQGTAHQEEGEVVKRPSNHEKASGIVESLLDIY